ncbi:hypothetical protein [Alicyclobacillus acidoterrestris]|nr:hypothetical protein [Alicyclobacillus acidoterrestris]
MSSANAVTAWIAGAVGTAGTQVMGRGWERPPGSSQRWRMS